MTKDELLNKAHELFWGKIDTVKFAAYVDEFEQVLLQQAGVSRSTFFTTDDNVYSEHHREEAERLRDVLIRKGFDSCGIGNAESLWSEYSDSYAAGWLGMPDEDDEIFDCVQPYIRKFVYCG